MDIADAGNVQPSLSEPCTAAYGYIRVSTVEQTKGFGPEIQDTAIRGYCETHGLHLAGVYRDEGISGSNGLEQRTGLADLLARLHSEPGAALILYRLDRLARDLILQETILVELRKAGIPFYSVQEPDIDTDDPTRKLGRQIMGAIAEYERAVIRGRMQSGKAAKAARGGFCGGVAPFGWRLEDGELVKERAEQVVIERARVLHSQGWSLRMIGRTLEEQGCLPRGGGSWHPKTVRALLLAKTDQGEVG